MTKLRDGMAKAGIAASVEALARACQKLDDSQMAIREAQKCLSDCKALYEFLHPVDNIAAALLDVYISYQAKMREALKNEGKTGEHKR